MKIFWSYLATGAIALLLWGCSPHKNSTAADEQPLHLPDPRFRGAVSADPTKAVAAWPDEPRAPKGAPNVVLILIDDVGFSTTSTFGGPIETPNFNRLAAAGLRYNNFHVNALCSPTRASLLSGRNNHQMGFGDVAESASGFPGYNTLWPKSAACVAEVLKDHGFSTAAFGKWHNTPTWQVSPAGPFDRWPMGLGFEHFYGFLAGYDNQYYPRLFRDTVPVEPPADPQHGYDLTTDLTDDAIRWLHQHEAVAPDKPFFLYFAPGATHMPHQVQQSWIQRYKGKFDAGWDQIRLETFERQKKLGVIPANAELTPRPPGLPAWNSLPPNERKLLAHQAEVYAAFTAQTDYEVGRLLKEINETDVSKNTLVIEIFGDNGASAEGGLDGYDAKNTEGKPLSLEQRLALSNHDGSDAYMNHFASAWAWALSSPFKGTKMDASHLGGTTDPMVISWPNRIQNAGGLRTQFQHVTDIVPTIYEATGVKAPDAVNGISQSPLNGSSLMYTFDHPGEVSHHGQQYFATLGNVAIYKDGWWAGKHLWDAWDNGSSSANSDSGAHSWELYNLDDDYSQAHDLAVQNPQKLKELQDLFDQQAQQNQVYPLFPPSGEKPFSANGRALFKYKAGVDRLPSAVAPQIVGRRHTITADIDVPASGADGVIVAQGSRYGGFTLFVKNRHVIYEVNAFGNRAGELISKDVLKPGKAHIALIVVPEPPRPNNRGSSVKPGTASMTINGVGEGTAAFANLNGRSYTETLDIGRDLGSPVSPDYQSPDSFTGAIDQVMIQLR
jgi:arylsulfatase